MKKRTRKILQFLLISLTGLITGLIIFVYLTLQLSLPVTEGEILMEGIESPIEITYDQMGIPQVWAKSEKDALFGLGYLHAADRLFQMDLTRRFAQGRLSEIIGSATVGTDIEQRTIGHSRLAQKALATLSDENKELLQAYSDGINAYVANCRVMPFEYKLLPGGFDQWSVYDCLTVISFQAWYSHGLMSRDNFFKRIFEEVSPDAALKLLDNYPFWGPTTVPKGSGSANLGGSPFQNELAGYFTENKMPPLSNSWVVSAEKSISDKAILACDPHLETTRLPQFWYLVGLHASDDSLDVIGITSPGVPLIAMGHNLAAAWSFTAGGVDITEYYYEKINPDDSNLYLTPNGWATFESFIDTLFINNQSQPEITIIRATENGPVVMSGSSDSLLYTNRWAGFDTDFDKMISSAMKLHKVSTFDDFRTIVTNLGALNANWLYADSADNIGYQLGTPLPIRPAGAVNKPLPGWQNSSKWLGYYPLKKTPHALNPEQGWLASCNNKPTSSSGFDIPGNFFTGRMTRIGKLLSSQDIFSSDDMKRFQLDLVDSSLLRCRNDVSAALRRSGHHDLAQLIKQWDGSTKRSSRETLLLVEFLSELKKEIFEESLGELFQQVSDQWMMTIFDKLDPLWFGNNNPELSRSVKVDSAIARALSKTGDKKWGDVQSLTMKHPLAVVPVLSSILDLEFGPWPWPGTGSTLRASFYSHNDDSTYSSIVGPSFRMIIDMADIDNTEIVIPAGNSGNPFSDHFFDFHKMWQEGEYWSLPLNREAVDEAAVSRLTLSPAQDQP